MPAVRVDWEAEVERREKEKRTRLHHLFIARVCSTDRLVRTEACGADEREEDETALGGG